MIDDIVTRLKKAEHVGRNGSTQLNVTQLLLNRQAVAEIERLRADRDNWKDLASEYYHLDPKCECHLCDRFREAMSDGDR